MKIIDDRVLDNLFFEAKNSSRKRSHYLLHASYQEPVQRLLIGMLEGSYVEPHYHSAAHQWEMFSVLDGLVNVCFYHENGLIKESYDLSSGSVLEIEPGEIHSVKCLSHKALLLEVKEGPFNPDSAKRFLNKP